MEKQEYSTTIKHETILDDTATNSLSCATSKDDTAPYSDAFSDDISRGKVESRHKTILGGGSSSSASISLHRCVLRDCCDNRVHCPFCDIRQYKPAQPARVRDHLHLTHFQHAVYYDGLMMVKCFHTCRGNETKGGHYHCPVCSTTLLKRTAFTKHLHSHAARQGLESNAVQAPDAKKPAVIYYEGRKIELCQHKCPNTLEPHFHCPLCRRSCEQLSSLTAHLWRCKKWAASMAAKADSSGCNVNLAKLFSQELAQSVPHLRDMKGLKWHLSIVRNLSDLPMARCELPDCCKARYHCPLCTVTKLKPNHLYHMRQHFVSHWRSGVKFRDYTVLVCYLPCELSAGADRIRFHYHCPLCGATRRRREGFARHLVICDPSQPRGQSAEAKEEELDDDGDEECMELPSVADDTFIPLSEPSGSGSSQLDVVCMAQETASRRKSADQAELQAAESLADLDRILLESLGKSDPTSQSAQAAPSIPPEAVSVQRSSTPLPDQLMSKAGQSSQPADELGVPDCSASAETVSEVNQSSREGAAVLHQSSQPADELGVADCSTSAETVSEINQSSPEEATVLPGKMGDGVARLAQPSQSDSDVVPGSQSEDGLPSSGGEPSPASIMAASKGDDASRVTSDRQSDGSSPEASELQIPVCFEAGTDQGKDEKVSALKAADGNGRCDGDVADNVQIFQQVTTQISSSIVSELQKRGDLEECLQAVGRACKVAWQRSGAAVTMTCDLDELCHAQNCLKQILKDGLQSFLDSPPAAPSSASPSADSTPTARASAAAAAPAKSGRKRGRPRGSKNKSTLLREDREDGAHGTKRTRPDVSADQKDGGRGSEVTGTPGNHSHDEGGSLMTTPQTLSKDTQTSSNQGRYSGRTRGKRINFALLNAGGVSPPREESAEESKSPPPVPPPAERTPRRARGRPRKAQPDEYVPAGVRRERSSAAEPSVRSTGTVGEHCRRGTGQGEAGMDDGDGADANGDAGGGGGGDTGGGDTGGERAASAEPPDFRGSLSAPDISIDVRRKARSEAGTPTLHIVVTHSSPPPPGPLPTPIRSSTSGKPDGRSLLESTTGEDGKGKAAESETGLAGKRRAELPESETGLAGKRKAELLESETGLAGKRKAELPESETGLAGKRKDDQPEPKSPTIAGRSSKVYRSRQGATDFAIIPNIIFDYLADGTADDEEDAFEQQAPRVGAAESSENSETAGADTASTRQSLEEEGEGGNGDGGAGGPGGADDAETQASGGGLLRCPTCKSTYRTYSLLTDHISSQHPRRAAVTCDVCEIVCPTSGALALHVERRHGPKPKCVSQAPPEAYKCTACSKSCVSAGSLHWHRMLVHKGGVGHGRGRPKLKCVICGYVAVDRWDMRHHREQHRDHPATCSVCQKTLSTEAALKVHMAAKHSSESFTCHVCGKHFAHVRYLRSHMQRHGGEKRHVCPVCGWRFHQTNTLKAHMDTHKPRTQRKYSFKCPHCPAAYNSRANWRDHLNKHSGARPHVCSKCGKGFAFRSMLTTHTAFVHSSARPHYCTECDKRYKTKGQLRQHMMTHTMARTGTSPFVCVKCGRPMVSKSRLHAHSARCKGGNYASSGYKQVLWRQAGTGASQGQESKLQAVDLIDLLTNQAINLQGPLVDLLPGQRIDIVYRGAGKDASITLVPVQNNINDDDGEAVLASEQGKPAALTSGGGGEGGGVLGEQEGPSDGAVVQGVVNATAGAGAGAGGAAAGMSDAAAAGVQQTVLIPRGGVVPQAALHAQVEFAGVAQAGPRGPVDVVSVVSGSGATAPAPATAGQQTILVRNGQAVSLLSKGDVLVQPEARTLNAGDVTGDASSASADRPQSASGSHHQMAFGDGVQSQAVLQQSASGSHYQVTFGDGVQSQAVLQQSAAVSHQVVLSDGFGHTQTLLLPADFLKQEVVLIESEDGQQNVIDLSNVQIVHADNPDVRFVGDDNGDAGRSGGPEHRFHILQSAGVEGDVMQVFQTHVETAEVCESSSSSSSNSCGGGSVGVKGGFVPDAGCAADPGPDPGPAAEVGESEVSVYMCSTCSQQFDSLVLAEQHVLVDHSVLDAPLAPPLPSDGGGGGDHVALDTEGGEGRVSVQPAMPEDSEAAGC